MKQAYFVRDQFAYFKFYLLIGEGVDIWYNTIYTSWWYSKVLYLHLTLKYKLNVMRCNMCQKFGFFCHCVIIFEMLESIFTRADPTGTVSV